MTTKYKIIAGFAVMILLLTGSAYIGYKGIRDASESFHSFSQRAHLDVALSDMNAQVYAQAYTLERFLQRQGPEYMQQAIDHMRNAAEQAKMGIGFAQTEDTRRETERLYADALEYTDLLKDMQSTAVQWMNVYANDIEPQLRVLHETTSRIGAAMAGNGMAQASLNDLWDNTAQVHRMVSTYATASGTEDLKEIAKPMSQCRSIMAGMAGVLESGDARDDQNRYMLALEKLSQTVEANKPLAVKISSDVRKTYAMDEKVLGGSLQLNKVVDTQMEEQTESIIDNNADTIRTSLILSGVGIALGILLAAAIIYSLIAILRKSSAYAKAVADGDFDYDPRIREKGEIGGMVSSLRAIPDTLKGVMSSYGKLEKEIQQGQLLATGSADEFKGDFATLVEGTNNITNSFRSVLENIPSPVVMLDKNLKATYLNAVARDLAGSDYQGKNCFELFARDDFGTEADGLTKAVNTKRPATGETRAHPQGKDMDVRYTAIPMLDSNGDLASVLQLITDLTELKSQQRTMRRVADEASTISDRVASASEELAAQVEQVSSGAESQRERMESAASAMTEMNSTVAEVARNASQASEQSEETRKNAESGAALVNQVVSSINEVNGVALRLQENMEELEGRAESIGEVMNVISDIADQTNLLALNAAIEAARAGEAGRGFAVVADEVRKLAEKTMRATHEVGASITAIQHSARANLEEVTSAVRRVVEATELAGNSGDALKGIVELVAATSSVVASIATAAEEQSATSEEITRSVEEVSDLVRETSEGMVQSSAAVQELASIAQDLKRVLGSLD